MSAEKSQFIKPNNLRPPRANGPQFQRPFALQLPTSETSGVQPVGSNFPEADLSSPQTFITDQTSNEQLPSNVQDDETSHRQNLTDDAMMVLKSLSSDPNVASLMNSYYKAPLEDGPFPDRLQNTVDFLREMQEISIRNELLQKVSDTFIKEAETLRKNELLQKGGKTFIEEAEARRKKENKDRETREHENLVQLLRLLVAERKQYLSIVNQEQVLSPKIGPFSSEQVFGQTDKAVSRTTDQTVLPDKDVEGSIAPSETNIPPQVFPTGGEESTVGVLMESYLMEGTARLVGPKTLKDWAIKPNS